MSRQTRLLTFEQFAYIVIGILALLMHLWGLGERALHHDETLHAVYSWNIYTGKGYMHDPLLHGPFLYHFGALMFFLFSDNDFTARLGFALFGIVLTLLPLLLRRELGRTAALLASAYLLISPAFLYVGRFARHDIYSVTFELLVVIAIVRYASTRQPRWLYMGTAALALMYTNQETTYLFLLIIGIPLLGVLLWHTFKPAIAIFSVAVVAVAAFMFVLPGEAQIGSGNNATRDPTTDEIQVKEPGPLFGWGPLETADNSYGLRIRNRADTDGGRSLFENAVVYIQELWSFFRHPAVLSSMGVSLATLGLVMWFIWFQRGSDGLTMWQRRREHGDGVVALCETLVQDKRLLIAAGLFFAIYATLFTAFFTNMLGVITGTTGSLLYWLAQHDVQRGGQPPHYYVVLMLLYEPVVFLWSMVGLFVLMVLLVRRLRNPASTSHDSPPAKDSPPATNSRYGGTGLYLPLFLAWWSIAALFIYSWAGEKMPWLSVHVALPLVLLGAWTCQWFLVKLDNASWVAPLYRPLTVIFSGIFVVASVLCFIDMTTFIEPTDTAMIGTFKMTGTFVLLLIITLFVLLVILAGLNWGWGWAISVTALCLTFLGGVYTIRNTYRLSYQLGDVPREMLIYTQTSPDVARVVRDLRELSFRRTRGLDMPVIYDNETIWKWYMRDFTNAQQTGPVLSPPGDDVMAMLLLQENIDNNEQTRQNVEGFRLQRLPLRWWFPEDDIYRLRSNWREAPIEDVSLLGRIMRAPTQEDTLLQTWQFLMYRDTQAPLGSTDFVLAVRPEVADQMGLGIGANLSQQ